MVLIFNETSDKESEWHDTQIEQKQSKSKQRIVKAWAVSLIIIL